MSALEILKKEDGYWLSIGGKVSALIHIVSQSPMVLRAIEEAVENNELSALRSEIERLKEYNSHEQEAAGKRIGEFAHQNVLFHNSNVTLREEIERLKAERTWQPIETAPEDITAIVSDGKYVMEAYNHWGYWTYGEDRSFNILPTHYMPLPQPPEDE